MFLIINYTPDFHGSILFLLGGSHFHYIPGTKDQTPMASVGPVQAPKATENEFPAAPTQQVHHSTAGPVVDSGAEDATGYFGISFKDI